MIFFTDYRTKVSRFVLLNIRHYPLRDKWRKMIFIDPSVYELKHREEYSRIKFMKNLLYKNKLRDNEYISIDYPCDMLEGLRYTWYGRMFVRKTMENNMEFKDNPHYICTVQFKKEDHKSFKRNFDYLKEEIDFSERIVAIGNLCRIMGVKNSFMRNVKKKLIKEAKEFSWLHFYGLSMKSMRYLINDLQRANKDMTISVDSTKWTFSDRFDTICCRKTNRNLYFLDYMKKLKIREKIPVIY